MNLKDYKQLLSLHDWHYSSSNDERWYNKGLAEEINLKKLAEGKKTYEKAYQKEKQKHFK